MKILPNTETLKKALAAAGAFCSPRATMPILANVRLEAQFGELAISATNLEAGATLRIPCAVSEDGVTTVSGEALVKIISMLTAEFVTIETDTNGNNLLISCGGYKGKLPTLDADDFPAIKREMPENTFTVPTAPFVAALNAVTRTASTDESRPTLTGVELTITGEGIRLAATDGYRLTVDNVTTNTGVAEPVTLIIPAKNMDQIAKLAAKGAGEEMKIGYTQAEFCALITAADDAQQTALVGSALLDSKYPDYNAIIPKTHKAKAVLSAAQLRTATQLAMLSADKKVNIIEFTFRAETLALSAMSDNGQAVAEIPVQMTGAPITMKFNGKYVLDMLAGMPDDALMFETTEVTRPGLAYSLAAGKNAHLAVIMPMHPGK